MTKNNKIIGYTAGCFDMFHVGHLNILKQAKKHCDYLVVGVNSDKAMFRYKNKYPIIPEEERREIVSSIRYVDETIGVDNTNKMEVFKKINFDIIFVGDDHKGEDSWKKIESELEPFGSKVVYFNYTKHISSTKLRKVVEDISGK